MADRFVTVPDSLELPAAVLVPIARLSDAGTAGRAILDAETAADGRTALGLGGAAVLNVGTGPSDVKAGNYQPTAANISDSTAAGRALITAADALGQRDAIGLGVNDLGLAFGLDDVTETVSPTIGVIGSLSGVAYGQRTDGVAGIYRSTDDGATWQHLNDTRAYGIVSTGDGEVIANGSTVLRKSSGWTADPTTATFTTVATANGNSWFIQSALDSYDNIVITAEYANPPRNDSRYVKVSVDHGATFTNTLDLNALYPGQESATHWHAVCIDPWHTGTNPRLWASHGDGPRGVYYSDDLGANWTLYVSDWQPMPLIATPNGIVCSTDQYSPDGVWLIPRTLGAKQLLHRISEPFWSGSMLGFGASATRDPRDSSRVVLLFRADQSVSFTYGNPARIFVSDGYRASEVYATANTAVVGTSLSVSWDSPAAITSSGKLLATYSTAAGRWTVAGRLKSIAPTRQVADAGNVLTGVASGRSDIAIGPRTVAARRSVVIGSAAGQAFDIATDSGGVAVGEEASIRNLAVAVGYKAVATSHGTAAGQSANAGDEGVAIGSAAAAIAASTAVGKSASASGSNAVAVGKSAAASGAGALAVGLRAVASHTYAVALGTDAISTAASQVTFGIKHIEMGEQAAPTAPAADKARLFVRDNGAGKTQLVILFGTGAVQVIATEP